MYIKLLVKISSWPFYSIMFFSSTIAWIYYIHLCNAGKVLFFKVVLNILIGLSQFVALSFLLRLMHLLTLSSLLFVFAVGFVVRQLVFNTRGIILKVILVAGSKKMSWRKLSVLERNFGAILTIITGLKLTQIR